MKQILWIILGWSLLITVHAASFDCVKAKTKIDKIICTDDVISKLDDELNSVYRLSLQNKNQAALIVQAQKQWLKKRNRCQDSACIKSMYLSRINEFKSPSGTGKLSNRPMCEKLAMLANSGELWRHLLRGRPSSKEEVKYQVTQEYMGETEPRMIYEIKDATGIHKYASFLNPNWGSCSGVRIWSLEPHTATTIAHQDEGSFAQRKTDDEVDLSEAGADDEMVAIGEDTFVVSTYGYYDKRTLKSAASAKDGYIDEICTFSSDEEPNLVIRKANNQTLCQSISGLEPLPWDDQEITTLLDSPNGIQEAPPKHMVIDLNKDGRKDLVGLFEESSGGGCGATTIYLSSDDKNLNKILLTNKNEDGQSGWGHNIYQNNYDVQIFEIDGKPYVLGNSELVSLWGNQKKTWCEFESLVQHHVSGVYETVNH